MRLARRSCGPGPEKSLSVSYRSKAKRPSRPESPFGGGMRKNKDDATGNDDSPKAMIITFLDLENANCERCRGPQRCQSSQIC